MRSLFTGLLIAQFAALAKWRWCQRLLDRKNTHDFVPYLASRLLVHAAEMSLVCNTGRAVEDHHAITDLHRLVDLMRDEHGGLIVLPHQPHEFGALIARGHLVE